MIQHLSNVTCAQLARNCFKFHTHGDHILPYHTKEPVVFPYIRNYRSTPSLLNNPDTDCYQDNMSQSFHSNPDSSPEPFNLNTLIKTISQYQNVSP